MNNDIIKFRIEENWLIGTVNNDLKQIFKGRLNAYHDDKNIIAQKINSNNFTFIRYLNKIIFKYTVENKTKASLFVPAKIKITNNSITLDEQFSHLSEFEIPENLKPLFLSLERRIDYLENKLDYTYSVIEVMRRSIL